MGNVSTQPTGFEGSLQRVLRGLPEKLTTPYSSVATAAASDARATLRETHVIEPRGLVQSRKLGLRW